MYKNPTTLLGQKARQTQHRYDRRYLLFSIGLRNFSPLFLIPLYYWITKYLPRYSPLLGQDRAAGRLAVDTARRARPPPPGARPAWPAGPTPPWWPPSCCPSAMGCATRCLIEFATRIGWNLQKSKGTRCEEKYYRDIHPPTWAPSLQ